MNKFLVLVKFLCKQLHFHFQKHQLFIMFRSLRLLHRRPVKFLKMRYSVLQSLNFRIFFDRKFLEQLVILLEILVLQHRCFILMVRCLYRLVSGHIMQRQSDRLS